MPNKAEQQALEDCTETYLHYRKTWQDHRDSTEKDFRYVLGDQWDATDKANLEKAGLPYLTKNIISPVVNKLTGIERANRTDTVIIPAEGGMEEVAAAMTRLYFHFAKAPYNKLEYLVSYMFLLGLIGDLGAYIRPYFTTEYDPLGEIRYKVIPGMNVMLDPMGREYGLQDHHNIIYTTWWTKKEAINHYPDKTKDVSNLQAYKPGLWGLVSKAAGKKTDYRDDMADEKEGRYRVIEKHKLTFNWKEFWYDPFTEKKFKPKTIREQNEMLFYYPNAIRQRIKEPKKTVTITIGGNILLYDGPAKIQDGKHDFIGFFPYYFDGDMLGIVNNLLGYQDEHNKRSSSILHIINTTANSGWLAKQGSVDRKDLEESAGAGANIFYKGEKPERIEPGQLPQAFVYMDEQSKRGIYETSGLGENMMGRAETNRESGALFEKRTSEGYTMLESVFDNLALTKEMIGDKNVWMYQHVLPPELVRRVLEQEGMPQNQAVNQQMVEEIVGNLKNGKYNTHVENVSRSASAKEREAMMLYQLVKVMPPDLVPWDMVAESINTPAGKQIGQQIRQKMAMVEQAQAGLGELAGQGQPEEAGQMKNTGS